MGKKSGPKPTDPVQLANAQGQVNKETALLENRLNNQDTVSPFGNLRFQPVFDADLFKLRGGTFKDPTGIDPNDISTIDFNNLGGRGLDPLEFIRFKRIEELTPTGQSILDQENDLSLSLSKLANQQAGRVSDTLGQGFDFNDLPKLLGADDLQGERQRVEDALFNSRARRVNSRFDDDRRALEAQLAAEGVPRGTEAFSRAMSDLRESRTDALNLAQDAATAGGSAELANLFGLSSAARDQLGREKSFLRNVPINDVAALLGSSQLNVPQFAANVPTNINPADLIGATALSANMGNQRANRATSIFNNIAGGLFSLGGSLGSAGILSKSPALAASDRRVKTDISRIGRMSNGLGVYTFKYVWGGQQQTGVMADEVKQVIPEAVITFGGIDFVDYSRL